MCGLHLEARESPQPRTVALAASLSRSFFSTQRQPACILRSTLALACPLTTALSCRDCHGDGASVYTCVHGCVRGHRGHLTRVFNDHQSLRSLGGQTHLPAHPHCITPTSFIWAGLFGEKGRKWEEFPGDLWSSPGGRVSVSTQGKDAVRRCVGIRLRYDWQVHVPGSSAGRGKIEIQLL
jgi:hypothetical protein